MKLSKAIQHINSAVNYPSLSYIDIDLFFDMAIAELNTTLHTSIPSVSYMIEEFRQELSKTEVNKYVTETNPGENYEIPSVPGDTYANQEEALDAHVECYYSPEENLFYVLNKYDNTYSSHKVAKCIYLDGKVVRLFQAFHIGRNAFWNEVPMDPENDCDLDNYLPDDWVLLWLILYVCYKYTVRDGGTSQSFAEELSQGFQQLQETYNVPDKVLLTAYADKKAYKKLVEEHLPNINIYVPTRAICEDMKHSRNTNAVFESFYDRGGF